MLSANQHSRYHGTSSQGRVKELLADCARDTLAYRRVLARYCFALFLIVAATIFSRWPPSATAYPVVSHLATGESERISTNDDRMPVPRMLVQQERITDHEPSRRPTPAVWTLALDEYDREALLSPLTRLVSRCCET